LFHYDGVHLIHLMNRGGSRAGDIAGWAATRGGWEVLIDGRVFRANRVIWAMVYGVSPADLVVHLDGDKRNNRIENLALRDATFNNRNVGLQNRKRRGFKGVTRCGDKWLAQIKANRTPVYLGRYETETEALAARMAAEKKHWGDASLPVHEKARKAATAAP
jgi:hypothetical protein